MHLLIINCSLDINSKSFTLAQIAQNHALFQKYPSSLLDLRNFELPISNGYGQDAYQHPDVLTIHDKIAEADAILLAVPIYNFNVNAACKNLVELTGTAYPGGQNGKVWERKVIGMIASAGGNKCYTTPLSILSSFMLDFRSVIVPQYVYCTVDDYIEEEPIPDVMSRIHTLVDQTVFFAEQLLPYTEGAV